MRRSWLLIAVACCWAPAAANQAAPPPGASRWQDPVAGALIEQGLAAVRAGRYERAYKIGDDLERRYPAEPARFVVRFSAIAAQRRSWAASIFARMATERPVRLAAPLSLLDPLHVRTAIYLAEGQDRLQMARAILTSGWSSGPRGWEPVYARRVLIDDAIDRNDPVAARRLLDGIDDPEMLRALLEQDRYAALHPAIVERWGENLAKADAAEGLALADIVRGPGASLTLFARRADWLAAHGDPDGALTVLKAASLIDATIEDRALIAMATAKAMAQSGSGNEAVQRLAALTATLPRKHDSYTEVAKFRAVMLGDLGRPADALMQARSLEAGEVKDGGWIQASLKRIEVCAAADAGDLTSAQQYRDALLGLAESDLFKAQALFCLGENDRAAGIVASALRRQRGSSSLEWLQQQPVPAWGRWQRRWQTGFDGIRDRPAIREALKGYATIRTFVTRPAPM